MKQPSDFSFPSSGAPTVGFPEGMMFFEHRRLWEDFFHRLGCRVVCSGCTTNRILTSGVELCCNETCLPVKVFTGHAAALLGKADFIFIPRYARVCRYERACPKLCGLPDEVRLSLKNEVQPLEVTVDLGRDSAKTRESLGRLARELGRDRKAAEKAFSEAVETGLTAEDSPNASPGGRGAPVIAVLGHPYMIYDDLLSMGLIGKLRGAGYRVLTPYDLKRSERRRDTHPFLGREFFETGLDILGGAPVFLGMPELAGMIYLTPFACGVDSLVTEFIDRRLRSGRWVPFLKITVDEHSGEAGFDTRLEAFLDMLPRAGSPRRESV